MKVFLWETDLYPKGSKIDRLYGAPKNHKSFLSGSILLLRPIVSSIDTYNYKLAQYFGSLLSPDIPSNYETKDKYGKYGTNNFAFRATHLWNQVPDSIKNELNAKCF